MNKVFVSNLALVIGLNLVVKPLYIFGIDRTVQNVVGPGEYGLYFALFNFVYLMQIFNDFGIQNYSQTMLSKHNHLIPKYLPKIFGVKCILGGLFILGSIIMASAIGFGQYLWPLLCIIVFNHLVLSWVLYLRATVSAMGFYRIDSILSVIDKGLLILGLGFFFLASDEPNLTIFHFVIAQNLALVTTLAICLVSLRIKGINVPGRVSFDRLYTMSLLRQSYPYALILLFMTLYTRMDGVMIKKLLSDGDVEAGIYAASYRILDAVSMLGVLFAGLLLPMFAKAIKFNRGLQGLIEVSRNLLLGIAIIIVVVTTCYSSIIMEALYTDSTAYWSAVFSLLMISYLGICLGYIYGTLMTASEQLRTMNGIFVVGVVLNFVLNWILIVKYKALGAAVATAITQIITALALTIASYRYHRMTADWVAWSKILLVGVVLAAAALFLMTTGIPILVQWVILSVVASGTFLLLGVWRPLDMWSNVSMRH